MPTRTSDKGYNLADPEVKKNLLEKKPFESFHVEISEQIQDMINDIPMEENGRIDRMAYQYEIAAVESMVELLYDLHPNFIAIFHDENGEQEIWIHARGFLKAS